jgi:hypothetical protein
MNDLVRQVCLPRRSLAKAGRLQDRDPVEQFELGAGWTLG